MVIVGRELTGTSNKGMFSGMPAGGFGSIHLHDFAMIRSLITYNNVFHSKSFIWIEPII